MSDNSKEFYERVGTGHYGGGGALGQTTAARAIGYDPNVPQPPVPPVVPMTGAKRWAANDDTFWGATQTYDELPAGFYRCGMHPQIGAILNRMKVETDSLLDLPDDDSAAIIREFAKFWTLEPEFRARGFLMKRGFLLWGPPGSGKTSTVHLLIRRLISDNDGIVLMVENPYEAAPCLQMVRQIEPKRPVIAIMEDMDALVSTYGENPYLSLLDGEAQVDNIVYVATTNYPERLDRRFVDRPSRFDTVRYIGMPSADARRVYFQAKEPSLSGGELEEWVSASEGFSIAHLKEMIIAVRCFGQPLTQVTERLEAMHSRQPTSADSPDRQQVGFAMNGRGRGVLGVARA